MIEEFWYPMLFLETLSQKAIPYKKVLVYTDIVSFLCVRNNRWIFFFAGECHINDRGLRALNGFKLLQKVQGNGTTSDK